MNRFLREKFALCTDFHDRSHRTQQALLQNSFKQFDRHGPAGGEPPQPDAHDNE